MKRVVAFGLIAWSGAIASEAAFPPEWTRPTEPFRIFDDVYWVGTEGLAAYLFVTGDGLILLDAGMPENAEYVQQSIAQLGFHVQDVRYLLNSHAHLDHSGGLAALKEASGAELVASTGDREALEQGIYPGWEDRPVLNFPPVTVDRIIQDGEPVSLGGVTLTAHVTPGHSPGCTSWSFTARDRGTEHQALVFCSGSVALNRLAPDPQYPGIVDYRETFRRVAAMEVDAYLAPHPEQFGLAEKRAALDGSDSNPFVDPGEKDRRIAAFEQAFERALAEQQQEAP